jgi:predicted nucleic acid-binding protein
MIVVSNASPLIALSRIDRLHILKDLFGWMYIPDTVYQETVTNCGIILQTTRISQATDDFIKVIQPQVRHVFSRSLGAGEQGVLNLALERQAQLVLIDDKKARYEALELGLVPVFTTDILKRAEHQRLIVSYRQVVQELKKFDIYLPE